MWFYGFVVRVYFVLGMYNMYMYVCGRGVCMCVLGEIFEIIRVNSLKYCIINFNFGMF